MTRPRPVPHGFAPAGLIEGALNGRTPTAYDEREAGSRAVKQQHQVRWQTVPPAQGDD